MIIAYNERVENFTNFGEDIKRNCNNLLRLAELVDSELTAYSGDVTDINCMNRVEQLVIALNHEIKGLSTTCNSVKDELDRLKQLNIIIARAERE